MKLQNIAELENKVELRVFDYMSRKRYFFDSCIIGWVFVKEGEEVSLYHLYLKEKDLPNGEIEEIKFITSDIKADFKKENEVIEIEAKLQGVYEDLKNILKTKLDFTL